ncbi:MAG: alpha-glucan family phosphorylase [Betaproteobacteria bacterium HGW-Betaproteobacteria-1]|nr:MAG: alpha-glucan family phosphorylase [Betaproteobacteria bacterium HGW-Betaproteobacteria-1]
MEIGLDEAIPTYAGGLGILAGDTVRSAADQGIPMVVVTLLHRKGYFHQHLDANGWQSEEDVSWQVADKLQEMEPRCSIEIEGREVKVRAWRYEVKGVGNDVVPVYFLDTDLEENSPADRTITDHLYGGDMRYRLCQEAVLGIAGVRMLRALGYNEVRRFHMNEGHAALLTLELAYELAGQLWNMDDASTRRMISPEIVQMVKPKCIFTTHTPVPAGHDKFPMELVHQVITGYKGVFADCEHEFCLNGELNMTYLALGNSYYINGVAKSHSHTAQQMFAKYDIRSITNGVHAATWAAPAFAALFDKHIPGWRADSASLRYALNISKREVIIAHNQVKKNLIELVNRLTGENFDTDVFTIGFARRATVYKRPELLFQDVEQLIKIAQRTGPFQLIYAGKAHPQDVTGKEVIRRIYEIKEKLKGRIKLVYLEDYDIGLAKMMTAGVDLWLNTPQPPLEASGTSGMKAAVNGVPSLSILDGWWAEGCIEGVTGWAIGNHREASIQGADNRDEDAEALYNKLEMVILPMYCNEQDRYAEVMRHAIALNASFFNTERMLSQYIAKAYFK